MKEKLRLHILSVFLVIGLNGYSQDFNYHFAQLLNDVDSFQPHLQEFEDIGKKSVFDPGWVEVQEWLVQYYSDLGYSYMEYDTFRASGREQYNLIFSKQKIDPTQPYLIIGSHYDTRDGFGTNDNGSGVVATMEVAKALSAIESRKQVQFIHYAAEESGLLGSKHHANSLDSNDALYLMINLDQIAGIAGGQNDYIVIERDENTANSSRNEASARIADTVERLCLLYTQLTPTIDRAYSSDYIPYEEKGKTIIGLYHDNYGSFGHSPDDLMKNMDLVNLKETIRLSVAMGLYFAGADYPLSIENQNYARENVLLYPNPTSTHITVHSKRELSQYVLMNHAGKIVLEKQINQPAKNENIDLESLARGLYFLRLKTGQNKTITLKVVLQ